MGYLNAKIVRSIYKYISYLFPQAQRRKYLIKRISNFRKLIFRRLEEMKYSCASSVVRLIDDAMIHEFIESYKGMSMSIDDGDFFVI